MDSANTLVVRASRPAGGRRAVLLGLGLTVLILPAALLGTGAVLLQRAMAVPPPPEGAVTIAEPAPGMVVLEAAQPFPQVLEHYAHTGLPAPSGMSRSTTIPLVGRVDRILAASPPTPSANPEALLVQSSGNQTNWVFLLGSSGGSRTHILSGSAPRGGSGTAPADQLSNWNDARFNFRYGHTAGPIAACSAAARVPASEVWRIHAYRADIDPQFGPARPGKPRPVETPDGDVAPPRYWTGMTDDGTKLGVMERQLSDHTVIVGLSQRAGDPECREVIAIVRHN